MGGERFTAPVTVHIFLRKGNNILLLRRYQTGYEDGNYSVVAGHLDGGEQVIEAAIREAREEAGIILKPDQVTITGIMHRLSNDERIDFFVTATEWSGEIYNAEPHKCDELAWFSIHDLPQNTISYIKKAIELSVSQSEIWFNSYGFDNKEG
ncbi:NUDIX hydrolase [Brevibacillus laterosporus]|uniref:NUDIX hydrolase n=1 Tax=Brevibacillus laterosporus TaxID=1465 RepID=UPI00264CFB03|nr:NUDIX domain-containing protein [Brevibacillus laterosporus]MDN9008742.1 NUDIX domain-containing protein [Brevibacillus laterosporus]MDO0939828.1 NUDIX domain-containing protein [Brevibacillus laterosporus]